MKQLLVGGNVAYATETDVSAIPAGAVGFYYLKDGVLTSMADGTETNKEISLILGRKNEKGGVVTLPVYPNHFSYVKAEYKAGTKFKASFTVPAAAKGGNWTVLIVKKGVKFNERSKWSCDVYTPDTTMSANTLAEKLAKEINANSSSTGVKAEVSAAKITIEAKSAGVDYAVVLADNLSGTEVSVEVQGVKAICDVNHLESLAKECAADAGFEYTDGDANELYPNYGISALLDGVNPDGGFTIFTMKFAEPRNVKTRDEVVNQIVHVAFPTGAAAIATFEEVCKGLVK